MLRKWNSRQTFGTGSGCWLKCIILLCAEQWQWIRSRNEFWFVKQLRRVSKQGGVVVPRCQCVCVCVTQHFPSNLLYLRLLCTPPSHRMFVWFHVLSPIKQVFSRPSWSVGCWWGGGTGRGGRPENCISLCVSTPCPQVIDSAPTKTAHTHVGWRNTHTFVWPWTHTCTRNTHVRNALDPPSSTNKKLFAFLACLRLFILHHFLSPSSHIKAHTDMIHAHTHIHTPLHASSLRQLIQRDSTETLWLTQPNYLN